jgi:hypothetical protein
MEIYKVVPNQEYGKLTPLYKVQTHNGTLWLCRCRCGAERKVHNSYLVKGIVKTCGGKGCKENTLRADLTGQEFGKLKALSYNGRGKWKVVCVCGKEKSVRTCSLTGGLTKSCGSKGCIVYAGGGASSRQLPDGEASRNRVIAYYKRHAINRGLVWKLSLRHTLFLFSKICHYCGIPPSNTFCQNSKSGSFTYNGIDRKDNSKGYIGRNVVPCCAVCNRAKTL